MTTENPELEEITSEFSSSSIEATHMDEDGDSNPTIRMAGQYLSYIFHPFMIPLYATLLLLFGTTVMGGIPVKLKFYFVGLIVLNTLAIPAFAILMLYKFGHITSMSLHNRKERILPIAVIGICYALCIYMIPDAIVSFLLRRFIISALLCVCIAFGINFAWKISLHMIGMGGLTALLLLMSISGFGMLLWALCSAVILAGILASARLYLGYHTPLQIAAGFATGIVATSLVMLFI